MQPRLQIPEEGAGLEVIASVSGGKDSTALCLALTEAEIPHRRVFANTHWEARETYEYLDVLRAKLGPIDVVGVEGGMVARIRHRAGFPARMQRWCTRELKLEPLRAYHDAVEAETGRETISALGIRADESPSRAKMAAWSDEPEGGRSWGGFVWRPLLRWTVADVIAIHRRHGVPMNPLYHAGFDRVGCYPCVYSRKAEIALIAARSPERIAEIRDLEDEQSRVRHERNAVTPERYAHPDNAHFFRAMYGDHSVPIDEVVRWSRTSHGGRQLPLLAEPPAGGCMRWGLCEPPPASVDDETRVALDAGDHP